MDATYWHQVAQHLSPSQQVPGTSWAHMASPTVISSVWHLICHTSHSTSAIYNWYNFAKYNIFHGPDDAMLFVMVKLVCDWKYFCFTETLRTLFLLEIQINRMRNINLHEMYQEFSKSVTFIWNSIKKFRNIGFQNNVWQDTQCK